MKDPSQRHPDYFALPLPENIYEWHFTIRGPYNSNPELQVHPSTTTTSTITASSGGQGNGKQKGSSAGESGPLSTHHSSSLHLDRDYSTETHSSVNVTDTAAKAGLQEGGEGKKNDKDNTIDNDDAVIAADAKKSELVSPTTGEVESALPSSASGKHEEQLEAKFSLHENTNTSRGSASPPLTNSTTTTRDRKRNSAAAVNSTLIDELVSGLDVFKDAGDVLLGYEKGLYHGALLFSTKFPFEPPDITFFTPQGRFECNKKICSSVSSYHKEEWQPTYHIGFILQSLREFMRMESEQGIGALDKNYLSRAQKNNLAEQSWRYVCSGCGCHSVETYYTYMHPYSPMEVKKRIASNANTNNNNNNSNDDDDRTSNIHENSSSALVDSFSGMQELPPSAEAISKTVGKSQEEKGEGEIEKKLEISDNENSTGVVPQDSATSSVSTMPVKDNGEKQTILLPKTEKDLEKERERVEQFLRRAHLLRRARMQQMDANCGDTPRLVPSADPASLSSRSPPRRGSSCCTARSSPPHLPSSPSSLFIHPLGPNSHLANVQEEHNEGNEQEEKGAEDVKTSSQSLREVSKAARGPSLAGGIEMVKGGDLKKCAPNIEDVEKEDGRETGYTSSHRDEWKDSSKAMFHRNFPDWTSTFEGMRRRKIGFEDNSSKEVVSAFSHPPPKSFLPKDDWGEEEESTKKLPEGITSFSTTTTTTTTDESSAKSNGEEAAPSAESTTVGPPPAEPGEGKGNPQVKSISRVLSTSVVDNDEDDDDYEDGYRGLRIMQQENSRVVFYIPSPWVVLRYIRSGKKRESSRAPTSSSDIQENRSSSARDTSSSPSSTETKRNTHTGQSNGLPVTIGMLDQCSSIFLFLALCILLRRWTSFLFDLFLSIFLYS